MASALLQKTPYGSFGGQPGGTLSQYKNRKAPDPSVMDKEEELPLTAEELARSLAEKDALQPPMLGPISIDPTDWITPGGLAKVAAVLKGVLAPSAAVSTAMLVGSRAAGPVSQLARSLPEEMGAIVGHASPYRFSKFDSSKLKTGQGATSYGAGTYLAEHPAVIEEYEKEMLGKKASVIDSIDAQLSVYKTLFKDKTLDVKDRSIALERIKHYEAEKAALEAKYIPTSYKIDLPDEQIAKMLDWDKPLANQADSVRSMLKTPEDLPKPIQESGEPFKSYMNRVNSWKSSLRATAPTSFQTSQGSVYSMLPSGKILRDKVNGTSFESDRIAFVLPEEASSLLNHKKDFPDSRFELNIGSGDTPTISLYRYDPNPKYPSNTSFDKRVLVSELSGISAPKKGLVPVDHYKGDPHVGHPITQVDQRIPNTLMHPEQSSLSGALLYQTLAKELGSDVAASDLLAKSGIPGIKYLDQRSRSVGEGTSNFVIFEPELLKILESEAIK